METTVDHASLDRFFALADTAKASEDGLVAAAAALADSLGLTIANEGVRGLDDRTRAAYDAAQRAQADLLAAIDALGAMDPTPDAADLLDLMVVLAERLAAVCEDAVVVLNHARNTRS